MRHAGIIRKFPEGFGVQSPGLDAPGGCYETCSAITISPIGVGITKVLKFLDSRAILEIIFLPKFSTRKFTVMYLLRSQHAKRQMRPSGMIDFYYT